MKTRTLAVAALISGALAISAAPTTAAAQTAQPKKASEAKPGQQIGDWTYKCEKLSKTETACGIIQRVADRGTKREVLGVTVRAIGDKNRELAMVVTVPLGTFLGTGIAGKVDDNKQFSFHLQSCTVNGCQAAIVLKGQLLDEMKKGKRFIVGFKAHPGPKNIIIPVSLKGFDKGLALLK